eukprot:49606_1
MSKVSYQVLGAFTSILGFISVIGAAYIIYGAVQIRRNYSPSKTRPLFVINHVLYMSICDVAQQGWIAFSWLSVAFDGSWNANWSPISCKITGTIAQFFLVASASWNFVIAICLMRMLRATPIHKFEREIKYHHIFSWGISFILCIVPWFENAYGYTKNIELIYGLKEFECWISDSVYQLCLYLPAMIYVFIAFILLIFTFIQSRNKKIQHTSTSLRLAAYTIVFVVTWTFPIILRLHGMTSDKAPPTFTVWAHHISIACIGIGNAVIWGTSQSIKEVGPISRIKSKSKFSSKDVTKETTETSNKCYSHGTEEEQELKQIKVVELTPDANTRTEDCGIIQINPSQE